MSAPSADPEADDYTVAMYGINEVRMNTMHKTGEVMMQFDDEEPIRLSDVIGYGKFMIELDQPIPSERDVHNEKECCKVVFKGKRSKFTLYIKNTCEADHRGEKLGEKTGIV